MRRTPQNPRPCRRPILIAAVLAFLATTSGAWSPDSQRTIARAAARLAPPDLHRQLTRNRESYLIGVAEPFRDRTAGRHEKNADGGGHLDQMIYQTVNDAITAIRIHRPFNEISYRMGLVAHYVADANDPLAADDSNPNEWRYRDDFKLYARSVEPRMRLVFYGFRPQFSGRRDLPFLVGKALGRSRELYPLVAREYQRIGLQSGVGQFSDRSTAYASVSLAYSHAVSDIAQVLRYIWTAAGGIDTRRRLPAWGSAMVLIPLSTPDAPTSPRRSRRP